MTDETHSVPVASQVKKWFELVVEGEELEDQASTQETEEFNVCTLYQQKVKNSGPLLSWLCLRWLVTIID